MEQTYSVAMFLGLFLGASILWPYEPEDTQDPLPAGFSWYQPEAAPPRPDRDFLDVEDEWGDLTQIVLHDKPFYLAPAQPLGIQRSEQRLAIASGQRVLPGTQWINATLAADVADGTTPLIQLNIVTANDYRRSVRLVPGETTSLEIAWFMADWSPDPETRFRFTLSTTSTLPVEGRIRLEISRTDDPLAPVVEFKDRWRGQDRVRVFDQKERLQDVTVVPPYTASANQPAASPVMKPLPAVGMTKLIVRLDYNSTTPSDLHYSPLLSFRGADKDLWERQALSPTEARRQSQNGTFVWHLPAEPRMWDSPFAEHTRWLVNVNWHGDVEDSPTLMDGDFHFYIDAVRFPPD